MKITFLYSELMPNAVTMFKALVELYGADVHVVYWDQNKRTPYQPNTHVKISYHRRSEHNYATLKGLLTRIDSDCVYVVGWMDALYLRVARIERAKGIPVVAGFDDWWQGTVRQTLGRLLSPLLTNVLFSHAWVAGPRQYEYAKRLGFRDNVILPNLLSCDTDLFSEAYNVLPEKGATYPKMFLYAGRFSSEKGITLLAKAFQKYRAELGGHWRLVCVGNGPLAKKLTGLPGIEVREFVSQRHLMETMRDAGAFVLASVRDFSPLVVHEAACAGLPMVLSSNVGNIHTFMIDGYNGAVFESGSVDDLAEAMRVMSSKTAAELTLMGQRSQRLSERLNPEFCAASLVSCIPASRLYREPLVANS